MKTINKLIFKTALVLQCFNAAGCGKKLDLFNNYKKIRQSIKTNKKKLFLRKKRKRTVSTSDYNHILIPSEDFFKAPLKKNFKKSRYISHFNNINSQQCKKMLGMIFSIGTTMIIYGSGTYYKGPLWPIKLFKYLQLCVKTRKLSKSNNLSKITDFDLNYTVDTENKISTIDRMDLGLVEYYKFLNCEYYNNDDKGKFELFCKEYNFTNLKIEEEFKKIKKNNCKLTFECLFDRFIEELPLPPNRQDTNYELRFNIFKNIYEKESAFKGNKLIEQKNSELRDGSFFSKSYSYGKSDSIVVLHNIDKLKYDSHNYTTYRNADSINTWLNLTLISNEFCMIESTQKAKHIIIIGPGECNMSKGIKMKFPEKKITLIEKYCSIKSINISKECLKQYFYSADDVYFGDASIREDIQEIEKADLIIDSFAAGEYCDEKNLHNYFNNIKLLLNSKGDCYVISHRDLSEVLNEQLDSKEFKIEEATVNDRSCFVHIYAIHRK